MSLGVDDSLLLTHAYDDAGRLATQTVGTASGHVVLDRSYRYRADGHLIGMDGPSGEHRAFDLDESGRTTAVRAEGWVESYTYGTDGGRPPLPGRVGILVIPPQVRGRTRARGCSESSRTRYHYDKQGRMVRRQRARLSRKPETWTYTWDAEDRLVSVRTPDGVLWRYEYDPMGRRIAKQRLGADDATVVEQTDFTWDGTTLIEQVTSGPAYPHCVAVTWDYDGERPLTQTERLITASQEEIDTRFFAIVTDLAGTPTELVAEDGSLAWQARSTLWGSPLGRAGAARTRHCGSPVSTTTTRAACTTTSTAITTPRRPVTSPPTRSA